MAKKDGFGTILIIGIGAVVVMVLVAIILFLNQSHTKQIASTANGTAITEPGSENQHAVQTPRPSPNKTSSPTASSSASWKTYTTNGISLKYPNDWLVSANPVVDDLGTTLFVASPDTKTNTIFRVYQYDARKVSQEKSENILTAIGLKKSSTVINGVATVQYTGTLSTTPYPTYEKVILLTSGSKYYLIKMSYTAPTPNNATLAVFQNITNSLHLEMD